MGVDFWAAQKMKHLNLFLAINMTIYMCIIVVVRYSLLVSL